jgi:hypothetical protein
MAKIETITFVQNENDAQVPRVAENYTQVNGIYGIQITPQFLNATDNVQHSPDEYWKATQAYEQQGDLRFFRML